MFAARVALVALSAVGFVSAQSNSNSTFKIDPATVNDLDKSIWCNGQQDSCQTLCGSVANLKKNDCDTSLQVTLNFVCECVGDNYPDMNKYTNTMPYYVCQRLFNNCIVAHENDAAGQKNCTSTYMDHCGTESVELHQGEGAILPTTTTSSSVIPTTAAPTTAAHTSTTSSSKGAAAPTAHVQVLGNGAAAVALGVLAYVL
ncbi:hypothetical protein F5Y17DRAFT_225813 [Xylariaceae sp. FL0594]|nr:hypothetical protein F5Y17DRAFT_225813 [Xylariaceae sp. FL0594]